MTSVLSMLIGELWAIPVLNWRLKFSTEPPTGAVVEPL